MEAQAQTVEVVDAGVRAYDKLADSAGVATATMGLMVAVCLAVIVILYRRLEKRDLEIADMRVKCAQEIAQAKLDAEAEVQERFNMAWQRVGEIFGSVSNLFGKMDASNAKVAETLKSLELVLAQKGIVSR